MDSLSLTPQRCLTFPHLAALRICRAVSDCVPGGPEFPEGQFGRVSQFGCQGSQTADSGPPDLASTRTALLYCLNLGAFHKSHLKGDETDTQSIFWQSRKRESSIHN